MKIVDYHVHSTNSFDGKSSIEEMCQKALEMKLYEICFTEHYSVDSRDVSYGVLDYEKYSHEIEKVKEKFNGSLIIGKGLEIGEPHLKKCRKELDIQTKKMNLDFIIGSIHNIDGVKLRLYMKDKEKDKVYYDYFYEIYKMVSSADIDVIGHMDLMKRYAYEVYGNYDFCDYREIIGEILKIAISKGIGLEINGSGYLNSVGEPYPKIEILKLYRELGGDIITVGSDSHNIETLAKNNLKMIDILRKEGFKYISTFSSRKRSFIKF